MSTKQDIIAALQEAANEEYRMVLQSFFKTGPGQYGEGDLFLGIKVPVLRKMAKSFRQASVATAAELLHSGYHEARLLALFLLINHYDNGDERVKTKIFNLYLSNSGYVNNWDLVDLSASQIVGNYLWDKPRHPLDKLAESTLLWDRRIAIVATYYFIKRKQLDDTFRISAALLGDKHDLIHKAVGWMLREAGKIDREQEKEFLNRYYREMPRTMLRYAIERFPEPERQDYLKGRI